MTSAPKIFFFGPRGSEVNKFTKLKHDWTLIDEGVLKMVGAHQYKVVPPEWFSRFQVSEWADDLKMHDLVRQAGERIVDEILRNAFVKEAVDEMVTQARHEGYYGAYHEVHNPGWRYDFADSTP